MRRNAKTTAKSFYKNNMNNNLQRLTLRIGRNTLSVLSQGEEENDLSFKPIVVKSGVSMAVNLRQAFKTCDILMMPAARVRVLIDSDVLMVPIELFDEQTMAEMHNNAFPRQEQDAIFYNVLPDLNAVAVFAMNKDLKLVLDDHFRDVRLISAMSPVWRHMHQRSYTGSRNKLFGYFHEGRLEIFSFKQNRFKFCNSFEATRSKDALYFLIYVWNQLQLQQRFDELYLMGDIPEKDWMTNELKRYVQKVFVINPSAEFGEHPGTELKGVPFDLQTLIVKGR